MDLKDYQELNDCLNELFIELYKINPIFLDNMIEFDRLNYLIVHKFCNINYIFDSEKNNKLTFKELLEYTKKILKKIDDNLVFELDKIVDNGILNFCDCENFKSNYSRNATDKGYIHSIEISRDYNYTDILVLLHEFTHYIDIYENKKSYISSFFSEFFAIYVELLATKEYKINAEKRFLCLLKSSSQLYKKIIPLIAYDKLGNISNKTVDELSLLGIDDEYFLEECSKLLNEFRCNEEETINSLNYDYKYIFGTVFAYYALDNCDSKKIFEVMKKLDNEYSNLYVDEVLSKMGINCSTETIEEGLEIIDNKISKKVLKK